MSTPCEVQRFAMHAYAAAGPSDLPPHPSDHLLLSLTERVMISDDDSVRMAIGDCFVHLEKDAAEGELKVPMG